MTDSGYVTTNKLSEILSVSRPTVVKDIYRVRSLCQQRGLHLQSTPGIGLKLEHDELQFRRELQRIITSHFTSAGQTSGAFQAILLKALGFQTPLETVAKLVRKSECLHNLQFSDTGYVLLSCFLFVAVNRLAQGFSIGDTDVPAQVDVAQPITLVFADVMQQLHAEVTQGELFLLQETAAQWPLMAPKQYDANYLALENYVTKFIDSLSEKFQIDFLRDTTLFDFTIYYIDELLQHYSTGQSPDHPFADQVREKYPDIFSMVKAHASIFADGLGLHLEESNLAYLTMYVIAAREQLSQYNHVLRVLIVCPGSMATGQFLVSQIQKHFSFHIKAVCSVRNLYDTGMLDDVDLIVSTTPAWNDCCPFVMVSPLLKLADVNHIQEVVFQVKNDRKSAGKRAVEKADVLDRLRLLLLRQHDLATREQIMDELEHVLHRHQEAETGRRRRLSELISPAIIRIVDSCSDWRTAIRIAGEPMVQNAVIEEEYIDSCIKNCEDNGPYFVLDNGLAIVHTHPSDGLLRSSVGLLFIRAGVSFQHQAYGPVRLLFLVCLQEPNNKLLKLLMNCAGDAAFVGQLSCQKNGADIYNLLRAYEERADKGGGSL